MADALHFDLETRSAADLTKVGAHRYFEDPTTSIICASYRIGQGPMKRWFGNLPPPEVVDHIRAGKLVKGHNQSFERPGWNALCAPLTGVKLQVEQQDCTMSRALAVGLPASLFGVGLALKIEQAKDLDGHRLMMQMCKPKTLEPLTWHDRPEAVERLAAYCDQDVEAEADVDRRVPALSARERRVWELDQRINDRGFSVDLQLVQRAHAIVDLAKVRADQDMWRVTNGAIKKASQAKALADWINAKGIPCKSVADGEIDELIVGADMLGHEDVEAALRIRRASAGAFKFEAMLRAVCSDGCIRGSLQYHGTHGGRWAGRVVQPHNFKRMDTDEEISQVGQALDILRQYEKPDDALDAMEMLLDLPALEVLSLCARPMIVAKPGNILRNADFSNIEGRLNAWFAGEDWKLDAFRAFDAGTGPDLYKVTAGKVLGKPTEAVSKAERQNQGKVPELACGYQGGVVAFQKMGAKYGVQVADSHARKIVADWREANPRITDSWRELGDAAIEAVRSPGMIVPVLGNKVQYVCNGDFLWCKLPSGRIISYAAPTVGWKTKVLTIDDEEVEISNFGLSYWGSKNGRWQKLDLYGGAQCAHIVSGTARDLLVEAMFSVEAAGYPLILTIHDELLNECAAGFGSLEHYKQVIAQSKPVWARGLPMALKVSEGDRYDK